MSKVHRVNMTIRSDSLVGLGVGIRQGDGYARLFNGLEDRTSSGVIWEIISDLSDFLLNLCVRL